MRITSGFECFLAYDLEGRAVYQQEVVDQLLSHARSLEAQNEELKAMLRKHQWARYDSGWGTSSCPECGGDRDAIGVPGQLVGHSPDCALAKLIGE